jgi:hypothetical protein
MFRREPRVPASHRNRSRAIGAFAAVALVALFAQGIASTQFSSGPDSSVTGAREVGEIPEEGTCAACHYTSFGDNFNTPGGAIEILDLPEVYEADGTYDLRVRLHSDSTLGFPNRRWGFQITAVWGHDGTGAGTFVLPPGDALQTIQGFGVWKTRFYAEHTEDGTRTGLGGPVEWQFQWRAPSTPGGRVYFFAAGNAANGNFSPSGDFVFTATDSVEDITTPVLARSWGALKAHYR